MWEYNVSSLVAMARERGGILVRGAKNPSLWDTTYNKEEGLFSRHLTRSIENLNL
jgi:hypothetical protein